MDSGQAPGPPHAPPPHAPAPTPRRGSRGRRRRQRRRHNNINTARPRADRSFGVICTYPTAQRTATGKPARGGRCCPVCRQGRYPARLTALPFGPRRPALAASLSNWDAGRHHARPLLYPVPEADSQTKSALLLKRDKVTHLSSCSHLVVR
ncbi:homeobox protein cut-like 1 [Artibeus jamaicensis]|uniref:homeobox protein cut-like 1 n=1 Tax=Artibeus jamaicensis TaxID=9417 RepID=UPI00235AD97B|nr:homeobox protein cut-like 1 [Artibeus jamaicensis]